MYLLLKWFFIATLSDSLLGVAADLPDCDVCNLETYECSLDSMTSGFNPPGQGAGPLCGDCDEDGDCFCSCENQFERDPHCAELEAKYPECDDDYEGDMPCDPSQEDIDYYTAHCDERDPHCTELEAKYPECDDDYEGDMSCDPSQEDIDYYMAHCDEEANDCLSSCWECQDNRDTCLFEYDGNQDQDFDTFDCDIACTGSPDTSMCMSHSDCSGDTPFCYEGQCDSCQECHFCHDGIDGTCGSCGDGFPTQEDGPCDAHDGGDEQLCMSHSDCSGDTPFCYEGLCDSCQECHFCHDGIDGTCGSCGDGFPTQEDGPCEAHDGVDEWILNGCMSHSDCSGDTPFCFEHQCNSCQECHFCNDGYDGTCGPCGDGFPTHEDGPCDQSSDSGCPRSCVMSWVGDGWCDNGIVYNVDCTQCEHFTDAEGVFDGGDCNGESAVGNRSRMRMRRKSPGFHNRNDESAVGYKGNNQPLTEEVTGVWSHSNVWIQGFAVIGFFALLKSVHSVCAQKSGDTLYQDVSQEA